MTPSTSTLALVRCDRCRRRLATASVIGPHRCARLCVDCLAEWHAWRQLIYGRTDDAPTYAF